MKRLILSFAAVALMSVPAAMAQTKVSVDKSGLLKKIEKSDAEIANPKKAEKVATWLNRGKLFYDVESAVSGNLFNGQEVTMANIMFGNPTSTEQVEIGSSVYQKMVYPDFIAYADANGVFEAWEVTTVVKEGALDEAIAAYNKAYELDVAKKSAAKIDAGFKELFDYTYKQGSIDFSLGKYKEAGDMFEKGYQITQNPAFTSQDKEIVSSLAHDMGVSFLFGGEYEKSVKYFTIAEQMGYTRDGEIYYLLYHAYKGISENDHEILEKAKALLEKGMASYPDNANIIECMTDVYVALGEDPQGIVPVVEAAIAKDPENPALWNGLGRVYERLGDLDKSIAAFEHVATLMPDNFNAHYSVGILYIRQADDMMKDVNAKPFKGQAEYDKAVAGVFDIYLKSIAPLERAHELNPTEPVAIELLKNVTFRLRDTDPEIAAKNKKYDELFRNL